MGWPQTTQPSELECWVVCVSAYLMTRMLRAFLQKCLTSELGMLRPGLPASASSCCRYDSTATTSASARSRYSRCSCRYRLCVWWGWRGGDGGGARKIRHVVVG
jgi:hypothetical protein